MTEPLINGEYFMNRWPGRPTIFTRGNLKDMAPHALSPLTEDLICEFESAGAITYYNDDLGLGLEVAEPETWISGYFGHIYNNLHCTGAVGDKLPGSSARDIYQAYFGLVSDPDWIPPQVDAEAEAARGAEFLASTTAQAATLDGRVDAQVDRVVSLGRSLDQGLSADDCLAWLDDLCAELCTSFALLIEGATNASLFFTVIGATLGGLDPSLDSSVVNGLHVDLRDIGSAGAGVEAGQIGRSIAENADVAEALSNGAGLDGVLAIDPDIAKAVEGFLRRYGHRGPGEIELRNRTWRTDPDALLAWCARLGTQPAPTGSAAAADIRAEAEASLAAIAGPDVAAGPIGELLECSRSAMRSRENAKDPLLHNVDEIRRCLDVVTPRLLASGAIIEDDDIYLLRRHELRAALSGSTAVAEQLPKRREQFIAVSAMTVPDLITATPDGQLVSPDPAFFTSHGLHPPSQASHPDQHGRPDGLIQGLGAAPGQVTATVRLMHDPFDDFDPGDILVACTVDPGWSPLLAAAGAVVLELGGPLSHGAVVARELGIPCVVNVTDALTHLTDSAAATVDGAAGTVTQPR